MSWTTLLLLADGRFPSGSHAYSGGMEQAVEWGDVDDSASAAAFVAGRLASAAVLAAQVTAAAYGIARSVVGVSRAGSAAFVPEVEGILGELGSEVDARMASPAGRAVSRQQGRRWSRAVRTAWPDLDWSRADPDQHSWVVLGIASVSLGLLPAEAACLALYEQAGAPMWAAVRLLGLDPMEAAGSLARLVTSHEQVVRSAASDAYERVSCLDAASGARDRWSWISWASAPLTELGAEAHARREDRLFAS